MMFVLAVPAFADTISIVPATTTVNVSQTFSVNVFISQAADLYAYQFSIGFDPSVVSANSVVEGSFLAGVGATSFFPGIIDNVGGTISFIANSLIGPIFGASGDGVLATISLTSIGAGTSSIGVFNAELFDSFGQAIPLTTSNGSVTVNPPVSNIPEPSSIILLATGVLGWLGYRARLSAKREWKRGV
jgi:hypothetical protein